MTLKLKLNSNADQTGNCIGHGKIEIIKFNYDGDGNTLVRYDNENHYDFLTKDEIDIVLLHSSESLGFGFDSSTYYIIQEIEN